MKSKSKGKMGINIVRYSNLGYLFLITSTINSSFSQSKKRELWNCLAFTYRYMLALFVCPMSDLHPYPCNRFIPHSKCTLWTRRRPLTFTTTCKWCQNAWEHIAQRMVKFTFSFVGSTIKGIAFWHKRCWGVKTTLRLDLANANICISDIILCTCQ